MTAVTNRMILAEALRLYGRHLSGCHYYPSLARMHAGEGPIEEQPAYCTCGLDEVLQQGADDQA